MKTASIIILCISTLIALFFALKAKISVNYSIIGLTLFSVIAAFINPTLGFYSYGLSVLLVTFYPFYSKKMDKRNRKFLWLYIFPILTKFIFQTFHWSFKGITDLFLFISIIIFLYMLFNIKRFISELSISTLLFALLLDYIFIS